MFWALTQLESVANTLVKLTHLQASRRLCWVSVSFVALVMMRRIFAEGGNQTNRLLSYFHGWYMKQFMYRNQSNILNTVSDYKNRWWVWRWNRKSVPRFTDWHHGLAEWWHTVIVRDGLFYAILTHIRNCLLLTVKYHILYFKKASIKRLCCRSLSKNALWWML